MANTAKNAILRALVDGALTDIMVKTVGDQVYLDETTTLTAKIAALVTDIDTRAKSADVTKEISTAISNLIGGAPETYDTLKEIADYISQHEEVVTAINAAIGNKADKSTVEALDTALQAVTTTVNGLGKLAKKDEVSETELAAALKTKINNASTASHSHTNKAVLDGITAAKVSAWDAKGTTYCAAVQPTGLAAGDLWIQLI